MFKTTSFDFHGPTMQVFPEYFKENKYENITNVKNLPFHKAFNTELGSFEWLSQNPEQFVPFQKVMTSFEGTEWTEGFDLLHSEAKAIPSTPVKSSERKFFVDVGGGHGHQGILLGQKYPNLLGRLVLQDLPAVLENLPPIEGIEIQPNDFFEKQPAVGKYYLYCAQVFR